MFFHHPLSLLKSLSMMMLATVVALGIGNPRPASAGADDVIGGAIALGIIGTAAYCASNPERCGANASPRGRGGPADAIGLSRNEAMLVQGGLQNVGFYNGAIDGAIGAGTRAAIRQYQAAIGANATGVLTGRQINDLVALSPTYVPYGNDPVYMFNADLANDLTRAEVRQLQAELNRLGYNAGPVDGAFGGMTRRAISAYKAAEGLPGRTLASRRLLAHMMGWPMPTPAGVQFAAMKPDDGAQEPEPTPTVAAPTDSGEDLSFDIIGVSLGMASDALMNKLKGELGEDVLTDTVSAPGMFGGIESLDTAYLALQSDWPAAASEQFISFYDSSRPSMGALAAVRLIRMPGDVDRTAFEEQVLPSIIAKYGETAMFGDGEMWIGDAGARAEARDDPAARRACGALSVEYVGGGLWSNENGPRLDTASLGSVKKDCGEVLRVSYADNVIRIALWDSAALSQAVKAPEIKF